MHKKYAPQGLVMISVAHELIEEYKTAAEREKEVKRWLQKFETKSINFILDEKDTFLAEALDIRGLPCIYVFNRQGKWVRFNSDDK